MTPRTKKKPPAAPVASTRKLFKVLLNGRSTHGGTLTWSLPGGGKLGAAWHEHEGKLDMCVSGLHLTSDPIEWWKAGSQVYEAEYQGEILEQASEPNKTCVRKCRLLKEVEWSEFQVWSEGHHRAAGDRKAVAYNSATVEAYGSATVRAYDSATVEASGSATVEASGSATVEAYGSATVIRSRYHSAGSVTLAEGSEAVSVDRRGKVTVEIAKGAV